MEGSSSSMSTFFCPHISLHTTFSSKFKSKSNKLTIQSSSGAGDSSSEVVNSPTSPTNSEEKHLSKCSLCESTASNTHLWRCLNPNCFRLFCGSQSKNHAQLHYEDNHDHYLQKNASNRRIWCNECNHEVFPDWRNRRGPPAIWFSADKDEEYPKGLYNIGNTCFMNAALQCMMNVMPLNSYFLGSCCNLSGKNIGNSYLWLLSEIWSEKDSNYQKGVIPSRLLHSVRTVHPIFRGFQQHDTQEFLRLFMDSLAEETRVPHFILDSSEDKNKNSTSNKTREGDEMSSSESETDSFETCDSGNASEETNGNGNNPEDPENKEVKVVMRSIVSDIFDGQIESSVQCLSCKQINRRTEVFQDLSLPIPTKEELSALRNTEKFDNSQNNKPAGWIGWFWDIFKSFFWGPVPTLEDCLAAFFSSDELKGKNMYSCEKCKKLRNGVKRCSLQNLPEILCVHLKRFRLYEFSGGIGMSGKVSQYVQFPLDDLKLDPFLHKDCPSQVSNYRLNGAICHLGSFLGGHYIAYIRRGDEWFLCDDSRICPVSSETVLESEAYVLFYQKWNEEDSTTKTEFLEKWNLDNKHDKTTSKEDYHLISRKWLTRYVMGEEPIPLDNSDVVCPHGFIVPYEHVHLGAEWIPSSVWNYVQEKINGGPDMVSFSECSKCTQAWKKHLKAAQKAAAKTASQQQQLQQQQQQHQQHLYSHMIPIVNNNPEDIDDDDDE